MVNRDFVSLNGFNLFKKCISILLPGSVLVLTFFVEPSISQEMRRSGTSKIFLIEDLSPDNKLTVKAYKADPNPVEIIDLSNIDITEKGKRSLTGSYFGDKIPDFKLMLLGRGDASIKSEQNASEAEMKAQEKAKLSKSGVWAAKPIIPSAAKTVTPSEGFDWLGLAKLLGAGLIGLVTLYGFKSTIDLLIKLFNSHHVDLIMLGLGSTGKSYIVARLLNPDIAMINLQNIPITQASSKRSVPKINVGKYELFPTYVDTAGNQAGSQINVMFPKRNKSIWVIVLSSTDIKNVDFNSQNSEKINQPYIDKQLGYIRFPLEILESSFCKKPEKVIICIGKFDIFSQNPPNSDHQDAQLAEAQLKKLFEDHVNQVTKTCDKNKVKHEIVICSALKRDWGTKQIETSISSIFYPR